MKSVATGHKTYAQKTPFAMDTVPYPPIGPEHPELCNGTPR